MDRTAGRRATFSVGDVRTERVIASHLVRDTVYSLGRLDILVTNDAFQCGSPRHRRRS